MTRTAVLAVAISVLVAATAYWRTLSARIAQRPDYRQTVVRLVDAALSPRASLEANWLQGEELARERPLLDHRFPQELAPWIYLPAPEARLEGGAAEGAAVPQARDESLHIPGGRGVLLRSIEVEPGQVLALDARVQVEGPGPAPEEGLRQCRAIVLPLGREVQLRTLLRERSLTELWEDPDREFLCLGKPPPNYPGEAFVPRGRFQHHRTVFEVPLDCRALLLILWTGEGSYESVDVRRISLAPVSARRTAHLGGIPATEAAAEPDTVIVHGRRDPRSPATYGIQDLARVTELGDAALARTVRRIDCLGEVRDGFLLPPPARLGLDVQLPEGPLVLEFGRAVLHERRPRWRTHDALLEVTISVDGGEAQLLHRETLRDSDPTGWLDRSVDLSAHAGRRVRLEFRTDSRRTEDLIAVGAPLIRRRAPLDDRPNVILVSIDTLRADRLSCEGHPRPTTPHLDELARRNLWFRRAHSTSSYTLPSHASMMTGQLPSMHGAVASVAGRNRISRLRSQTLAERLREEDYLTAAFTGGNFVGASFGFGRGFDRYSDLDPLLGDDASWWDQVPVPDAPEFNRRHRQRWRFDAAVEWLRQHRDGRFFLFLHTYAVHEYRPSPEQRARFVSRPDADPQEFLAWKADKSRDARTMDPALLNLGNELYDATVADADAMVGSLIEYLRSQRLWYDTLLIVTSDHGEEFLEHGRLGHGRSLDQVQLRVPLIVHLPGEGATRRIEETVSLTDLVPTVLDLLQLDALTPMQGRSLRSTWEGAAEPGEAIAELALTRDQHFSAIVEGDEKLCMRGSPLSEPIWPTADRRSPESELRLYDLRRDPHETLDLAEDRPGRRAELREALARHLEAVQTLREQLGEDASRALTEAEAARARELGYLDVTAPNDEGESPR